MNIYFACSITGGREFESVYQAFVSALGADGHTILTAHLASPGLTEESALTPRAVFERDTAWIRDCNVLIAEVSIPSHGVGYEIGYALNVAKPVLCLFQERRKLTKMIGGNPHPLLSVQSYDAVETGIQQSRLFLSQINL
jgi:hypothetical protein